jgi:hypothetical protein
MRTTFRSVTKANPCAVCGGARKCSRGEDGVLMCGRCDGDVQGFVHLGAAEKDPQFHLYRRDDDPVLKERQEERDREYREQKQKGQRQPHRNGSADPPPADWSGRAREYAAALTPALRDELAAALGVRAVDVLALHPGWRLEDGGGCWTIPEVDAAGRTVGISRRYRDSSKKNIGKRGLYVPDGWRKRLGPIFLPEGASNTAALTAMNLAAVGRPSNTGGVDHLIDILSDTPVDRPVIVVCDWDPKPDGDWPGLKGKTLVAPQLAAKLGRPVHWVFPPDKTKDVRKWLNDQRPDPTNYPIWVRSCPPTWRSDPSPRGQRMKRPRPLHPRTRRNSPTASRPSTPRPSSPPSGPWSGWCSACWCGGNLA